MSVLEVLGRDEYVWLLDTPHDRERRLVGIVRNIMKKAETKGCSSRRVVHRVTCAEFCMRTDTYIFSVHSLSGKGGLDNVCTASTTVAKGLISW